MKWTLTNGRKPRTGDKKLHLKFRTGTESKYTYTASQIRAVAIARGQA